LRRKRQQPHFGIAGLQQVHRVVVAVIVYDQHLKIAVGLRPQRVKAGR